LVPRNRVGWSDSGAEPVIYRIIVVFIQSPASDIRLDEALLDVTHRDFKVKKLLTSGRFGGN